MISASQSASDQAPQHELAMPGVPLETMAAVGVTAGAVGCHTGIVLPDGGSPKWLHLAWHFDLRFEEVQTSKVPPLRQVVPHPSISELELVAEYATLLGEQYATKGLPYGFAYRGTIQDTNGSVLFQNGDVGLTCATLVLMVFRRANVQLLTQDTWGANAVSSERIAEDRAAQEQLLAFLDERAVQLAEAGLEFLQELARLKLHIAELREQLGSPRYRAEEVAAASGLPPPSPFAVAEPAGRILADEIRQLRAAQE